MLACYMFYLFILLLQNPYIHCRYLSNGNLKLDYDFLQPITHAHLKQFYSVFILHRNFINERLLTNDEILIQIRHKKQLRKIHNELNKNIARLYHVVSYIACIIIYVLAYT